MLKRKSGFIRQSDRYRAACAVAPRDVVSPVAVKIADEQLSARPRDGLDLRLVETFAVRARQDQTIGLGVASDDGPAPVPLEIARVNVTPVCFAGPNRRCAGIKMVPLRQGNDPFAVGRVVAGQVVAAIAVEIRDKDVLPVDFGIPSRAVLIDKFRLIGRGDDPLPGGRVKAGDVATAFSLKPSDHGMFPAGIRWPFSPGVILKMLSVGDADFPFGRFGISSGDVVQAIAIKISHDKIAQFLAARPIGTILIGPSSPLTVHAVPAVIFSSTAYDVRNFIAVEIAAFGEVKV